MPPTTEPPTDIIGAETTHEHYTCCPEHLALVQAAAIEGLAERVRGLKSAHDADSPSHACLYTLALRHVLALLSDKETTP